MLTCVTPVASDQGSPGAGDKTIHPFTGPDQSPLSALLPAWSQWADNGCSELTPARPPVVTPTPGSAPPSHVRRRRSSEFVRARRAFLLYNGREGGETPSQWPFCRQTRFLFFLFFSHCQIQFCTQFTSSFFSPPLFFRQRQKSLGQRRPSFRLNHSDTKWIVVFVCFSSFQLEPGSQVSHTEHVWERREAN